VSPNESVLPLSRSTIQALEGDAWFGEPEEAHSHAVSEILHALRLDEASVIAARHLHRTLGKEALVKQLGQDAATLLIGYRGLRQAQAKLMKHDGQSRVAGQEEILRKMLLAFGNDLRVVLIYLASRLQTLRWIAKQRFSVKPSWAQEILDIDASLANRLGIWQMKWEMEDLAFRVLAADTYKEIAGLLDSKRVEREQFIADIISRLNHELSIANITADVQGRPKHIYSIWKKMQGKSLEFASLYDVRAFRVLVDDVKACYATLGLVHNIWQPVPKEFDDYIARPKPNGYQSLHTVVIDEEGIAFEIQIRTQEMHRQAEYGLAAHWRYKEGAYAAQAKDLGTHSAAVAYERQIAWARQLISWKEDAWEQLKHHEIDDHIYVLTPLGKVIALEKGSSPIDFAYAVHTDLGHRCRGARIDGAMVPLDTALHNGQTVEIISVKQGGPSRDWLNPERGYLRSQRARARVRAWFNALDDEVSQAPTKASDGKLDKSTEKPLDKKDEIQIRMRATAANQRGDVLVVGVDSLLTQLAKCCRPVPPDPIAGFVTQGRGVSIHRRSCKTFRGLLERAPERVIQTAWSAKLDPKQGGKKERVFPADLSIIALDRPELMRELFEITSKIGIHVIDLKKSVRKGVAHIQLTVEISNAEALRLVQTGLEGLRGVTEVRRR
jgi:GTP pyrophosphokinase